MISKLRTFTFFDRQNMVIVFVHTFIVKHRNSALLYELIDVEVLRGVCRCLCKVGLADEGVVLH